jgi:hypothetical protein
MADSWSKIPNTLSEHAARQLRLAFTENGKIFRRMALTWPAQAGRRIDNLAWAVSH